MSELLSHRLKEDEKLSRYVKVIVETTQRASELTQKMLAFSRKGKVLSKPVDLDDLIGDVTTILERSIDPKIKLIRKSVSGKAIVKGDPGQLQNALLNLALNARDAMPSGGILEIGTECVNLEEEFCNHYPAEIHPGYYVHIYVRDTGHGIPHNLLSKIFEPFFTTKEVGKGTGLGLAAVYGTVIVHHGALTVESKEGDGTIFHIHLPLTDKIETAVLPAVAQPQKNEGQKTVLVVDDEPMIREMATALLEEMGFVVICAENGREALEKFRQHREIINLVLLDTVMPVMNGTECFYELKRIDANIKIILSSGFTQDSSLPEFERDGLSGFIKKPYGFRELRELIDSVL